MHYCETYRVLLEELYDCSKIGFKSLKSLESLWIGESDYLELYDFLFLSLLFYY